MMKIYPFSDFRIRNFIVLLGIVVVTMGLFLGSGQTSSWAAPEQNPHSQTVPPRSTSTPSTYPQPTTETTPAPAPTLTLPSKDDDDQDRNERDDPRPQRTTQKEGEEQNDEETTLEFATKESDQNQDETSSPETSDQDDVRQDQAGQIFEEADNLETVSVDLSLRKTVSQPSPTVGSTIALTTVISNSGPGLATNVMVRDLLPVTKMLVLDVIISGRQGSYETNTGIWRIETIAHSQSITMNLVAKVLEAGTVSSTAEVIWVDQPDSDSTPGNNLEIEDDQDSASLTIATMTSETSSTQTDNEPTSLPLASVSAAEAPTVSSGIDAFYWLYALILGAVFIAIGVFLVHRS